MHPRITADQLFADLETHNELRKSALIDWPVFRTYRLSDLEGTAHAEETGRMEFHAPDQKFIVASENGSKSLVVEAVPRRQRKDRRSSCEKTLLLDRAR